MRLIFLLSFFYVLGNAHREGSGEDADLQSITDELEGDLKVTKMPTRADRVKEEVDKAIHAVKTAEGHVINGTLETLGLSPSCTALDCTNRGTCVGTKESFICMCNLGFTGKNCDDSICESVRDCNGRGICLGTVNKLICLCNLGFKGHRCENAV